MTFDNVTLRCDCNAEAVVFTKYNYDDGDKSYGISFEDDYTKSQFNGLFGRFRRAWYAFKSKPVVHMDVFTDDKDKMIKFLRQSLDLIIKDDAEKLKTLYDQMNGNAGTFTVDPYYLEHRKEELNDSVTSNEELIKEGNW